MTKFNPISTLKKRSFLQNKGRNIVAVLAIVMTTLMFTTLFVLAQSMSQNIVDMTFRQMGYNADVSFKSITEQQAALLAAHPDVREVGNSIVLGVAENGRLAGRQVEIRWADESYATHSFGLPTTGSLPQASDEIALDTLTMDRLGIPHKLGETVTLEWRKDLSDVEKTLSTFTLCGYWETNLSSYASMAWISREFIEEMTGGLPPRDGQYLGIRMAQVSLYSHRNIESAMDKIMADTGLTSLPYHVNLAYSPEMNASASQNSLPMYLGMLLVFAAGYLIIYNIFQISVTADIQFYGKLKTLGTTTRQIKRLIYGQANLLCLIGIPIGIAAGYLLGAVLVPVLLGMMEGKASISASPVIFIGSALFAWLTVLISCLRPARMAGRISPIEALRYSDADAFCGKKNKKSRGEASLSGMAWSNLWRNKKRTITVICSLSLGLVLMSCFYAEKISFDMEKYLSSLIIADFELADASHEDWINGYSPDGTTLNQELLDQVEKLEGLESKGHMYSQTIIWNMDSQTADNISQFYTPDKLSEWASYDPAGAKAVQDAVAEKKVEAIIYGLDGIPLETMTQDENLMAGSFDAEKFAIGKYVLAIGPSLSKESIAANPALPTPSPGNEITLNGNTYTVMAIIFPMSPVTTGASQIGFTDGYSLNFALPSDTFRSQWPDNSLRKLYFNVSDEKTAAAQEMLDDYTANINRSLPVTSRQTKADQYEKETRSSAVMGNAISLVIALVGVLNFINSMVTAILSRRKEFAMIQSVGMTKRQLNGMLVCEGLFYAILTLAVSFAVSAPAVGIGVRAMVEGGFSTFRFTLMPLMVCAPLIIGFAILIPYLCFRNLEKQSIVERLRLE